MPTDVLMPALELAQETGKILRWLKAPGDRVTKGEPLVEIETDKITTEIEAPASGVLREVRAQEGEDVPVGRAIAVIVEEAAAAAGRSPEPVAVGAPPASRAGAIKASPLARRIAAEHGVDLARVMTSTGRIEKADVLAYIERRKSAGASDGRTIRLIAASPKARRLAAERALDLEALSGSGPGGAIIAADVAAAAAVPAPATPGVDRVPGVAGAARGRADRLHAEPSTVDREQGALAAAGAAGQPAAGAAAAAGGAVRPAAAPSVGTVWRIMAERMTASWTTAPHFYLVREVGVARLVTWRERASKQSGVRLTYTDLLVKLVAAALREHSHVNGSWRDGTLVTNTDVNIGLAVAIEAGLVVPVLHRADTLSVADIAARRDDLVTRAQSGKLRPADIQGGTFTISNLGMYGVDAFNAIVNPPQAAILAAGRIAERVVAAHGQPAIQPTMVLTLSCDHRAVDGARAARFLGALADLIEEPLALLM